MCSPGITLRLTLSSNIYWLLRRVPFSVYCAAIEVVMSNIMSLYDILEYTSLSRGKKHAAFYFVFVMAICSAMFT